MWCAKKSRLRVLMEGTENEDAINKHQLDTGLNTKVDNSEVSTTGDAEVGKIIRYLSDKGILTPRIHTEDPLNDAVVIKCDNQDFDGVGLFIKKSEKLRWESRKT